MDMNHPGLELYLEPTFFIDWRHPAVRKLHEKLTAGLENEIEIAARLFYYVRDAFWYSPYHVSFRHETLKASYILEREGEKKAYCTEKAVVFAALCRASGIPNRLIFCNVRNHIAAERFIEIVGTNLMVFHGYNEVFLNGKWVKCTVAFNKGLCYKLGVDALEFDGEHDDIFQEYDKAGGKFMVYEHEYGSFHDVPHDMWVSETIKHYGEFDFEMSDLITDLDD
jgi:hypothetical protein